MKASAFLNTEESNITLSEYEIAAKSVRSAKYKNIISFNAVYKGPCLNEDLYSLLLKFRMHLIVLTADLEKAY